MIEITGRPYVRNEYMAKDIKYVVGAHESRQMVYPARSEKDVLKYVDRILKKGATPYVREVVEKIAE